MPRERAENLIFYFDVRYETQAMNSTLNTALNDVLSHETIHANRKRFEFVSGVIASELRRRAAATAGAQALTPTPPPTPPPTPTPLRVLDVGCGNGVFLTEPLAARFPEVEFVGIDSDAATIALAEAQRTLPNLRYAVELETRAVASAGAGMEASASEFSDESFGIIIASEVIEHVEEPASLLAWLHSQLGANGRVVITTPNGYGAFEAMTALETVLDLLGVMRLLSRLPGLRSLKVGSAYDTNDHQAKQHDTLAISPHVNFFSYRRLTKLFEASGFVVEGYRARALFGGLGFQQLMRSQRALTWNAHTSDRVPARCASGWMFVLAAATKADAPPFVYRRRWNERLRRYLTGKRWGTL
jgi:2-polyprenyl-3-methyl-5-hydroxy-6-metoxy-1,4-benzoquinol methylase